MSRGRHGLKLSDTSRLIRAAVAAGQVVERIEHDPLNGRLRSSSARAMAMMAATMARRIPGTT
jgi:hypothetical protein